MLFLSQETPLRVYWAGSGNGDFGSLQRTFARYLVLGPISHSKEDESYWLSSAVVHDMFRHVFDGLETHYAKELNIIRQQYPSEPVKFTDKPLIIHWPDGMQLLRECGEKVGSNLNRLAHLEISLLWHYTFPIDLSN